MSYKLTCKKCKGVWRSEVKLDITNTEWSRRHACPPISAPNTAKSLAKAQVTGSKNGARDQVGPTAEKRESGASSSESAW